MAQFFIDRPIFAWVIAILIMLAGSLSILGMQVSQYPAIAPPTISVKAFYPGASAKTVEDAVVQVIEQKMNGLDGLMYMSSTSDSYGNGEVILTFRAGTDPDIAQVQVQNKLQNSLPLLPQEVQQQGVTVSKSTRNFLMAIALVSEDGRLTKEDLTDYLASTIQDPISRVNGVGEVQVFGAQYAMRVWMDPAKLVEFNLTPADLKDAIRAQNAEVSAGQLGGTPAMPGQGFAATLTTQTRLKTAKEFEAILLRSDTQGGEVRLGDVARVEIGSENYGIMSRYNGQPAAGMGIRLASGANALETVAAVNARMAELAPFFPPGVVTVTPYDTTPFVKLSIESVVRTLIEAVVLVFLVMFLFLQNLRATLIPTIAIPVVLLGTFGVMAALGFTINTLTLFGIVLAIGLLVDDAIVVVENVERIMSEEGLSPKEAARKSMRQITGALIGIGLVLSAVFLPMAFFGGSTGVIYRQFSISIVAAMALSVLVAIIFTPALCATILKPVEKGHSHAPRGPLGLFFRGFNRVFDRGRQGYTWTVGVMLRRGLRFVAIYLALLVVVGYFFMRMPTSFLPQEDQGLVFSQVILPAGASQERTLAVLEKMEKHFLEDEKDNVVSVFSVAGFSFAGRGQHMGLAFIKLRDWEERMGPGQDAFSITQRAMGAFAKIREAMVFAFMPPAVIELGTATGFDLYLQDRAGLGHDALMAARNQLLGMAAQDPRLVRVRPNGQDDMPEFRVDVDYAKAGALGVSVADINDLISTAWGSAYVNDFNDRGRTKKVYIQGEAAARMTPEDLGKWYVRNNQGQMVPLSAFATGHWIYGPPYLQRFNGVPAVEIMGEPAPGFSSGDAMNAMVELIGKLPPGIGYEWSSTSYEEQQSGSQAPALYALSILIVFLCLAALYESWSVPFAVMLTVPLGVLGAVLAVTSRGLANDVYFQVGLLATVGLSAKNAILIVEFAKAEWEAGRDLVSATLDAVRLRFRPILMTSLAFGFGVLPLALATGAGANSQHAIGTGLLGGIVTGTLLGLFFIPLFYVLVIRLFRVKPSRPSARPTQEEQA
jgi:multidrug efflux pump